MNAYLSCYKKHTFEANSSSEENVLEESRLDQLVHVLYINEMRLVMDANLYVVSRT